MNQHLEVMNGWMLSDLLEVLAAEQFEPEDGGGVTLDAEAVGKIRDLLYQFAENARGTERLAGLLLDMPNNPPDQNAQILAEIRKHVLRADVVELDFSNGRFRPHTGPFDGGAA